MNKLAWWTCKFAVLSIKTYCFFAVLFLSPLSLVLVSYRNSATMVTWRHPSSLYCLPVGDVTCKFFSTDASTNHTIPLDCWPHLSLSHHQRDHSGHDPWVVLDVPWKIFLVSRATPSTIFLSRKVKRISCELLSNMASWETLFCEVQIRMLHFSYCWK